MKIETLTLEKFSYGGESFGRLPDQRAVFVPFALPGERVRIQIVEDKKGYARGTLLEVLEASPARVVPRCSHFTSCGGCHYQHLPYPAQLEAKTEILRDQLRRIGHLDDPPIRPIIPSPESWNYRNNMQFHITREGSPGFQAPRSHQVISIQECHLPETVINETWPRLDLEPIPGLERLHLRVGANEELMLVLESSDPVPVELSVDLPISVVHSGPGGMLVLAGDDHLYIRVSGRDFKVSAVSFFQVNTPMAALMVQHILDNLEINERSTVIDAYCGVGLFSAFIAPMVEQVIGIESSPNACDDFMENLDEFDNVVLYEAPVDDILPILNTQPELVILDPPRAGLGRPAMDGLVKLKPEMIAYISCDPATLSRDARRLTREGYTLTQITPFDLFPQTYHIESISLWKHP